MSRYLAEAAAQPEDQSERLAYRPALDGVRAIAVAAVLLYHGREAWIGGGFLGVDLFFVLSGFLITTLLLSEHHATGTILLPRFWMRRIRRLAPALIMVLLGTAVFALKIADRSQVDEIRGDSIASLLHVSNWRFISTTTDYFDQFQAPSPLLHMWSLAIEAQFYLVWPLVVLVGMRVTSRWAAPYWRQVWITALIVATCASVATTAALYGRGEGLPSAYYNTFSRAQPILLGAAVAFLLFGRQRLTARAELLITTLGIAGLAGMMVLFWVADGASPWLYRGGFLVMGLAGSALVAAASRPGGNAVGALLALDPLPQIGRISYGLYVYHWPIYLVLTPERTGFDDATVLLVRLAVTGFVAAVSYQAIEMPIRQRRLGRVAPAVLAVAGASCAVVVLSLAPSSPSLTEALAPVAPADGPSLVAQANVHLDADPGDLKVYLVGDSTALTFGFNGGEAVPSDVAVATDGQLFCSVSSGTDAAPPESDHELCNRQLERWGVVVDEFKPDIAVLMFGPWETLDLERGNDTLRAGTRQFATAKQAALERAVTVLSARGAEVVVMNSPCYPPPGAPGEAIRPDPSRIESYNDVVDRVVASAGPVVHLADLHQLLCPSGKFTGMLNGVRYTDDGDGMHLNREGAISVWNWLLPQLEALDRREA